MAGIAYRLEADNPFSGEVGPGLHAFDTSTGIPSSVGLQVPASLAADAEATMLFLAPDPIPTGTPTILVTHVADATSGDAIVSPSWAAAAFGTDLGALSLTSEGNTTISHTTGDDDKLRSTSITMDATTVPTANQIIAVRFKWESTGWTLAAASTYNVHVVWV